MMMRHVVLLLILMILSNESFGADKCETTIDKTLRFGKVYTFDHSIGANTVAIQVTDFFPELKERLDFNGSNGSIDFKWTDELKKKSGVIEPNESLVFVRASQPYEVKFHGKTREINDIFFKYVTKYRKKNADGGWSSQIDTDTVCVNYAITWCGDGVVDAAYGEVCDNGSQNGAPGNQCSKTCEKISN